MNDSIFRQKSIDRISSPEELNSYMRVANPSVWIAIIAVALLVVGGMIWGLTGFVEGTVPAAAVSHSGKTQVYVSGQYIERVEEGMTLRIGEDEYVLGAIQPSPVEADSVLSEYALRTGGFIPGEYVYEIALNGSLDEGVWTAQVVTERFHAFSFLWN